MRTFALSLLACGLLALPVAASAAPHHGTAKKAAAHAPRTAKTKARHGSTGRAAHASRATTSGRNSKRS